MSVVANMIVNFRADVRDFKRGTAAVRSEMSALKRHMDSMKKSFGESSAFGEMTKIMRGAGVAAGIYATARGFEKIGQTADEFATAIRKGEMSINDIYMKSLLLVPVFKELHHGAMGFWNAIQPLPDDLRAENAAQNDITRSLKQQLDLLRARTDEEKATLKAEMDHENRVKQIIAADKAARDPFTADVQIGRSEAIKNQEILDAARKRYETELKISQTKAKYINQLEDELAYMSMTADEAERWKTFIEASDLGGWAFGKQAMDLVGEIQAKRAEQEQERQSKQYWDSFMSDADVIRQQIRTPVEAFSQEMERAARLVGTGHLGLEEFEKYGRELIGPSGAPGSEAMDWNSMYMSGPTTTIDKQTDIQREMAKKLDTMIEQMRLLNAVFAN